MDLMIINQGWTDNLGDRAIAEVMQRELNKFEPFTVPFAPNQAVSTKGIGKVIALFNLDRINKKEFSKFISGLKKNLKWL